MRVMIDAANCKAWIEYFDLAYEITTRSSASRRAPSSAVSAALVHSLVALVHCRWHARLAKIA